jgi:hypothetical protein
MADAPKTGERRTARHGVYIPESAQSANNFIALCRNEGIPMWKTQRSQ